MKKKRNMYAIHHNFSVEGDNRALLVAMVDGLVWSRPGVQEFVNFSSKAVVI